MSKSKTLTPTEIKRRARRIKLVLTDVDGTLTDTGVYYSANGEELKRYSIRDGMGMERLRDNGVQTAMMTREASPRVESRSKKLELPYYFPGVLDKVKALPEVLQATGLQINELAFIGDDFNDNGVMELIAKEGLTGAPADAMLETQVHAHFVAGATGGNGAFRDFAEWIIKHRKE